MVEIISTDRNMVVDNMMMKVVIVTTKIILAVVVVVMIAVDIVVQHDEIMIPIVETNTVIQTKV